MVLSEAAARAAGVRMAIAGPNTVDSSIRVFGRVLLDATGRVVVGVPHAGTVEAVAVQIGQRVEPGDLLGRFRSRTTLASYALRSASAGTVTERNVSAGDSVAADTAAFVVADLSKIWVELDVHAHDLAHVRVGQKATVRAGPASGTGKVEYLSPLARTESQTVAARVVLPNDDGLWHPGLYATADIVIESRRAPVVISRSAVHTLDDGEVVFVRTGDRFEPRVVTLGIRDGKRVEVLSGLNQGERYAAAGAFVVAAEMGKSGAVHAH